MNSKPDGYDGYLPPITTSSLTLDEIRSGPEKVLDLSDSDCRRWARLVRKQIDMILMLLSSADSRILRYMPTGSEVFDAVSSFLGQLFATLLGYSPYLPWISAINQWGGYAYRKNLSSKYVSLVSGFMAAIGMSPLPK